VIEDISPGIEQAIVERIDPASRRSTGHNCCAGRRRSAEPSAGYVISR
jgi:hypothetical protein